MNVDFNNLRKQALLSYDSLVEKLNRAILKESQYAQPNDVHHGQDIDIKGFVLIDAESIQKDLDSLRSLLASIALTYDPSDDNFREVYTEVYPGEDEIMMSFNENNEEC
jgi:hypothetical protein